MLKLTTNEIRQKWINFFTKKQHYFLEPVSLIPNNDPSLLWINSGVATLKDYFSGIKNPPSQRLVNSQKAIRTNDIFNVGHTARHHTFFEMLGNFSIGDYFKKEAIAFAYEFLIQELEMDVNRLWITVFNEDEEAYQAWINLGIDPKRIIKGDRERNFWDVGSGPCGPCTEIFFDRGEIYDPENQGEKLILEDLENDRYVEIWNIVFSQFNNDGKNNYTELKRKNIDTGAGLERIACVLQDVPTNFDADGFYNVILKLSALSSFKYYINNFFEQDKQEQYEINFAYKVIVDHMRASLFAIADGAVPANKDRGYVLRRLIRRATVFAYKLNIIDHDWINVVIDAIVNEMGSFYDYLTPHVVQKVKTILEQEVSIFKKTYAKGIKLFDQVLETKKLDAKMLFKMVDTYGFNIELIKELAKKKQISLDIEGFEKLYKEHQEKSQSQKPAKAMAVQNEALMNIEVDSKFFYDTEVIDDAQVIYLLDADFNVVKKVNKQDAYVIFDKTCFYATAGGQVSDTGYIIANDEKFAVYNVFKSNNMLNIHQVEKATLQIGDKVGLHINAQDRVDVMRNHSAEHLLHHSLKKLISLDIRQEGASKTPERATLDFNYHKQLTPEQLQMIEAYMNQIINDAHETKEMYMSLQEAKDMGALAYFGDYYKKIKGKLRVIQMGPSMELCGGTHVHNTKDIEAIKIIDFSSKGSGSYRVTMISGHNNICQYNQEQLKNMAMQLETLLKSYPCTNQSLIMAVNNFIANKVYSNELKVEFEELLNQVNDDKIATQKNDQKNQLNEIKEAFKGLDQKVRSLSFHDHDNKIIFNAINELINENQTSVFVSYNYVGEKIQILIAANPLFVERNQIDLRALAKQLNTIPNVKAGGKNNFIQGGSSTADAAERLNTMISTFLNA
ncbi:alanine--tRNA ligase [Ureaplasma miroungigenitalium]|uniref:Alanine--tRNA ligase n=1 Tax=Ureaplasma miroungigenitalium TaxID=1042321 RepID=A0ABT3BN38_9BACT|nr:alanine--tRNA ligase [Ureaplasma miroungigenitalium]MCV3728557.1 alanine--tRNA ligase [Ureaplasma miroungigenitalium]MCV3734436.1 alanine--tRNA ligase [Ureaplasma miroungigenitalium]